MFLKSLLNVSMNVPITWWNKKRQHKGISSITDFFDDNNSFIKVQQKKPLTTLCGEEEFY